MSHVAILPNHMKLGVSPSRIALDALIWPLGQPETLKGGQLGDLSADDHLIAFPRDTLHIRPGFGTKARLSLVIMEPAAIHGHHLKLLRLTHRRFHRILTTDEALIAAVPNARLFPFGSTWVPNWADLDLTKTKPCSLIASAKRSQEGHVLRHSIADWVKAGQHPVDLMGGGYAPFDAKSDGLAPYRYSVVIENVRERNYFTEKLIDALLCKCVPIYWGCPNIAEFIDNSAMIICENAADIEAAILAMTPEDYARRLPAIEAALPQTQHYADFYLRAARAVLEDSSGQMP